MEVKVGMADMKVCSGSDSIITLGLGSCVGVILYDPTAKVCGMLHAMLPDSTAVRNHANPVKFVDTGMDELYKAVVAKGANPRRLIAKVAGGAEMFGNTARSSISKVGSRNVEAVHAKLKTMGIPIKAEDTGSNYGRTVIFYPANGEYHIKRIGKEVFII